MDRTQTIEHKGVVKAIDDDVILVELENTSACGSCQSQGACPVFHTQAKTVEVKNMRENYTIGDSVVVFMKQTLGYKALFLGYIFPFLVVLMALIITSSITKNEVIAGVVAIAILIPYYLILYFFREKLKSAFIFTLKR
ncbi:MAG: SoxR reducing system RseC family protein [Candidatus Omnitrophota bacterium]